MSLGMPLHSMLPFTSCRERRRLRPSTRRSARAQVGASKTQRRRRRSVKRSSVPTTPTTVLTLALARSFASVRTRARRSQIVIASRAPERSIIDRTIESVPPRRRNVDRRVHRVDSDFPCTRGIQRRYRSAISRISRCSICCISSSG